MSERLHGEYDECKPLWLKDMCTRWRQGGRKRDSLPRPRTVRYTPTIRAPRPAQLAESRACHMVGGELDSMMYTRTKCNQELGRIGLSISQNV